MDINQHINRMELWSEEFQDNIPLRYDIVSLNPLTDCDGFSKKFLVPHAISCPKRGLVLAWHNNAAKE